jgi:hypothetical protein
MRITPKVNTMSVQQMMTESVCLIFAFIMGILSYSRMNIFFRTLFYQLTLWLLFYLSTYVLITYQKQHGINPNDLLLINLSVFLEGTLLIVSGYLRLSAGWYRYATIAVYILYASVFLFEALTKGLWTFENYSFILLCIIITILFSKILFDNSGKIFSNPFFWSCLGLVLYFACLVPYMSMVNYLNINYPDLSEFLFHVITDVLANVRYLFLAICFWIIYRTNSILNP